jgi:hypothetical protein
MNNWRRHIRIVVAALLIPALASTHAIAQYAKTVDGLVVNLGIVPAEVALRAEGHRDAHPLHPPSGSQHLLVTLDEEKSHKRLAEPEVVVEVTDPRGGVERKPLLHTQAGGLPDYSELFKFGSPGAYSIRVLITPRPGANPVEARFTVHHAI